jgi:type IV pilus assembly protein PilV
MRAAKSQMGVMLIEALIAILILAIGILALLGMQGTAIRTSNDARFRSEASFLATQIVGQMWIDLEHLASYDTDPLVPPFYAPRDNWVNRVAATLPGVTAGGPLSPMIQVGPDPDLGLAEREVLVRVQWQQPNEIETRQVVLLNRLHTNDDLP